MKYISINRTPLSVSYSLLSNNDNEIGCVEGYVNEIGDFISVVKINSEYQGKGFGFQMFKKVFMELNEIIPIKKIIGSWHQDDEFSYCEDGMSTNLRLFRIALEDNDDPLYCAFQTPTGKWALKLGYKQSVIKHISLTSVSVEFLKD